ncbi:MAG: toxin-antitoxin system YwqK family antitoxin [Bacteroidia bacterium]
MKIKHLFPIIGIILTLSFSLLTSSRAMAQDGFTNKAEARNEMKNKVKEGKWIEYISFSEEITQDTAAPTYRLTEYKSGKPFGIVREYYKNGKMKSETPYKDGKINGTIKGYYDTGILEYEKKINNDKKNGIQKMYYESGKLHFEYPYSNDTLVDTVKEYYENGRLKNTSPMEDGQQNGVAKSYYEDGKLKSEVNYSDGSPGSIRNYDENGNEIK